MVLEEPAVLVWWILLAIQRVGHQGRPGTIAIRTQTVAQESFACRTTGTVVQARNTACQLARIQLSGSLETLFKSQKEEADCALEGIIIREHIDTQTKSTNKQGEFYLPLYLS